MAIQTFTSGQVLTAAQVNALQSNDFNQTVTTKTANATLVASDKGTRVIMNVSTASTITVNTSIFSAGDTLILQNIASNNSTVTAGTATVSSAGSLVIPQFGSGTLFFTSASAAIFFPSAGPAASSSFDLISTTSLSGASTTFTNAFSATYTNYKVIINDVRMSSGDESLLLTYGSATSNYGFSRMAATQTSQWGGGFIGSASSSSINLERITTSLGVHCFIEIFAPFLTTGTMSAFWSGAIQSNWKNSMGFQQDSTSFTSFTLSNSGGITQLGTVSIYGYAI